MKNNLTLKSFLSSLALFLYVSGVVWLLNNAEKLIGPKPNFFGPLLFLLLFVFSAAVSGLLVFGLPIHLYLNEKKKDAFRLILCNLAWLFLFIIVVAAFLLK